MPTLTLEPDHAERRRLETYFQRCLEVILRDGADPDVATRCLLVTASLQRSVVVGDRQTAGEMMSSVEFHLGKYEVQTAQIQAETASRH